MSVDTRTFRTLVLKQFDVEDVTEGQLKVPNEELRDLNLSSVNIRVTKSPRMGPKKHVTCLK